jgi:hypothetical protein
MPQSRVTFLALCAIAVSSSLAGCAYHFQNSQNPLVELGIHRIYVENFRNSTYRPGLEHYFTTAMVREIAHSKSFELVNNKEAADAILSGELNSAEDSPNGYSGITVGTRSLSIANDYMANVTCAIRLRDRHGRQIFSQSITGNKEHPGTAAAGDLGATAPLNNDSEQRLAVQFVAERMMASAYQRMIDTF